MPPYTDMHDTSLGDCCSTFLVHDRSSISHNFCTIIKLHNAAKNGISLDSLPSSIQRVFYHLSKYQIYHTPFHFAKTYHLLLWMPSMFFPSFSVKLKMMWLYYSLCFFLPLQGSGNGFHKVMRVKCFLGFLLWST